VRNVVGLGIAWVVSGLGLGVTVASLLRLGWMRHGVSVWDLSFLHLDWVLQPTAPHWRAHVENVGALAVGLALLVGPGLVQGWRWIRK